MTAGDVERNHHAVARFEVGDSRTGFFDNADRFVADDIARRHEWRQHFVEMEVRPADRGRGDADDRIGRFLDRGVGHFFDRNVSAALPGYCSHELPSLSVWARPWLCRRV